MWPILAGLGGLVKVLLPSITDLGKIALEQRGAAQTNAHDENKAAQDAFAREFSYGAQNRTWFDSAIDGLNRMPRPLMALGCIWIFVYAAWDPARFAIVMQAMSGVPTPLWSLLTIIVSFFFVSRGLEKVSMGRVTIKEARQAAETAKEVAKAQRELEAEREPQAEDDAPGAALGLLGGNLALKDPLLGLAGFGPGELTREGYAGKLPISRAAGWRNPIALRYRVDDSAEAA